MATSTNGLPAPDLTDDNNPPADFLALANAVDSFYGRAVANSAALPASGTFPGQRLFVTATKEVAIWDGVSWTGYTRTYTPTWTNVTLGTTGLVNTAEYVESGRDVTVSFTLTLGTGGSFGGAPNISLPVTPANPTSFVARGQVVMDDVSVGAAARRLGGVVQTSSGLIQFYISDNAAGSQSVTASAPFTWAAGDSIAGTFTYKRA